MSNTFENKGALGKTIVVAASNSLNQGQANFVCDGVNDHVEIQAALDALPATGGEVLLLDGTFNCEASINLDTNQTLRGCGRNTILTTSTAALRFLSAVGGAGTEKTGIVIDGLQIDGGAASLGGVGIYFDYVDDSLIQNVYSRRHNNGVEKWGIFLSQSERNTLTRNTATGCLLGIYLCTGSNYNLVSDNTSYSNGDEGIYLSGSCQYNTIRGNITYANKFNIYLTSGAHNNLVEGNVCRASKRTGMILQDVNHITLLGNVCLESSQDTTNTYPNLAISNASYNNIQNNTFRAGTLANKPSYGIQINAGIGNVVIDNDLYNDGFGTAPFNDAGTDTKLNTYKVPFSHGSDPQDSGFLIDAATEMARAWLRLPNKVVQVVRAKVYARSGVLEADHMRGEFVIYGGADNEAYNTHDGSVANHPTDSVNFAANDIIFWTIATAGLLAMVGGDSIEVKAIYESAGNGDCATNAYLRTVEIEYV